MTFRYIGSKARVIDAISPRIGPPIGAGRFVDLFCGTGVVAEAAAKLGWDVHLNDQLHSAVIMAAGRLLTASQVKFARLGSYGSTVEALNALKPAYGFIHREYSPASLGHLGIERRYFSETNAARIDAMRHQIRDWTDNGSINTDEATLLLADLLSAVNRVANIAGTYGCFLSKWQPQASDPIQLKARDLFTGQGRVSLSVGDAKTAPVESNDLVYIDPPYTKRQYAAYYHLLETIALGDEPVVEGVGGLRPWRAKASEFCYRSRALRAFTDLIEALPAKRILVSYSDDAHIEIEVLTKALRQYGVVVPEALMQIGRYRPNRVASSNGQSVSEYLIHFDRELLRAAA